jgi:nucleoside-diphosphate-sugar epimerase
VNAFEKQIAATRKLVDLAMTSPRSAHARVVFTSSISVARNWPAQQGLFPEEALETPVYSAGTGYGEAKFVAESASPNTLDYETPC